MYIVDIQIYENIEKDPKTTISYVKITKID